MVDLQSWASFLENPEGFKSSSEAAALQDPLTAVLATTVLARKYEASYTVILT